MANEFDPLSAYSSGLVGCRANPRADEMFADYIIRHGGDPDGGNIAHEWEFAGKGEGKLTLLFPKVMEVFPECWPGPAQLWGDCVGAAAANCVLGTLGMEIADGKPDEVTGNVEGPPELPEEGIRQSVVARESVFAWRGFDGDGWFCSEAAKVCCEKGFLVRKPYPELGIDLTRYTNQTIKLGGKRPPSDAWLKESKKYVTRTATFVRGREQVRDMLHQGYCVFNCSSLGFSRTRNEDGFSPVSGSWAHAQCFIGYDDRADTVKKYGQALVLWLNSWNKWNSGPRRVRGTDIDIPHGAFWSLASTIDRCQCIALSSVAGWPRRKHTTYGAAGNV
jgi:hypothetical protein